VELDRCIPRLQVPHKGNSRFVPRYPGYPHADYMFVLGCHLTSTKARAVPDIEYIRNQIERASNSSAGIGRNCTLRLN
jgi:hypothetical protein